MESCGFIAHDVYAIALEATGGRCNPLLTEWLAGQYSTIVVLGFRRVWKVVHPSSTASGTIQLPMT